MVQIDTGRNSKRKWYVFRSQVFSIESSIDPKILLTAYQLVLKTVELSRDHLFDFVIQYQAIFTDEDPLELTSQNPNTNESAVFHSGIIQKV